MKTNSSLRLLALPGAAAVTRRLTTPAEVAAPAPDSGPARVRRPLVRRVAAAGVVLLALPLALTGSAYGQTTITSGSYLGTAGSNNATGPGGAGGTGYYADGTTGTGSPYTITGGMFAGGLGGNGGSTGPMVYSGGLGGDGLDVGGSGAGATVTITGGTFSGGNGGNGGFGGSGGAGPGGSAIQTLRGTVTVYGGAFAGAPGGSGQTYGNNVSGYAFLVKGGADTLYGTFNVGPQTFTAGMTGTFTGTLADNLTAATYTYDVIGGTLTLSGVVPEPSTWALLGIGTGLLSLTPRRRAARL